MTHQKRKGRVTGRHVFTKQRHGADYYRIAKQYARQVREDHADKTATAFDRSVRVDDTVIYIAVVIVREKLSGKNIPRNPNTASGFGHCFLCEQPVYARHPNSRLVGQLRAMDHRPEHFDCLIEEERIGRLKRLVMDSLENLLGLIVTEADFKAARSHDNRRRDQRRHPTGRCRVRVGERGCDYLVTVVRGTVDTVRPWKATDILEESA